MHPNDQQQNKIAYSRSSPVNKLGNWLMFYYHYCDNQHSSITVLLHFLWHCAEIVGCLLALSEVTG